MSLGLVCAHDKQSLQAIGKVLENGLLEPVLLGRELEIRKNLDELEIPSEDISIINIDGDAECAAEAVRLAKTKQIGALMKGRIQTGVFLKAVVNSKTGIRKKGTLLSHLAILELPGYHKILAISDAGMNIKPGLMEKKAIIENSVRFFNALGYEKPKIAVLAAIEIVNPQMVETLDAAALKEMEWSHCLVDGPISYDLTFSEESANIKGYKSDVTEDADILLMPNITTGNILCKALIYSAGAKMAGLVIGAEVPIIITSRGSTAEEKYFSLVFSSLDLN